MAHKTKGFIGRLFGDFEIDSILDSDAEAVTDAEDDEDDEARGRRRLFCRWKGFARGEGQWIEEEELQSSAGDVLLAWDDSAKEDRWNPDMGITVQYSTPKEGLSSGQGCACSRALWSLLPLTDHSLVPLCRW